MKVILSVLIVLLLFVGCTDSNKSEMVHRGRPPCKPGTYRASRCFFDYVLGAQIMTAPTCERYSSWAEAQDDPYAKWLAKLPDSWQPFEGDVPEERIDWLDNKTTPYYPKKMPLEFQFLPGLK